MAVSHVISENTLSSPRNHIKGVCSPDKLSVYTSSSGSAWVGGRGHTDEKNGSSEEAF